MSVVQRELISLRFILNDPGNKQVVRTLLCLSPLIKDGALNGKDPPSYSKSQHTDAVSTRDASAHLVIGVNTFAAKRRFTDRGQTCQRN